MKSHRGLLERGFNLCLGLFIAAALLHFAVQLIRGIWPWLVVMAGVVLALGLLIQILQARRGRW